jgi:hypothetical protein
VSIENATHYPVGSIVRLNDGNEIYVSMVINNYETLYTASGDVVYRYDCIWHSSDGVPYGARYSHRVLSLVT